MRNYKSYTASMDKTAFNISGFIQPAFVYEMLNEVPDADGLNDRQLFDFPPERNIFLDELVVPTPPHTPDLFELFSTIHEVHKSNVVQYSLEGRAYEIYREFHDQLVTGKTRTDNENAQGILAKARGYCARIAMVVHSLDQALRRMNPSNAVSNESAEWESKVSGKCMEAAVHITAHLNNQKMIMLGWIKMTKVVKSPNQLSCG